MEVAMEHFPELVNMPQDVREALEHLLRFLLNKVHPLIFNIHKILSTDNTSEDTTRIREVYTLCSSQINKCVINLLDVFKLETHFRTLLQESRLYVVDRLTWCVNRLLTIKTYLEKSLKSNDLSNDSINVITMYFVNWIDHTFQILGKLSDTVYQTSYKDSEALQDQWKCEIVNCVTELHISIDELLLSAMTLCRFCHTDDQHIVKARCKVVLRETKVLLCELIEGDPDSTIKAMTETLKLPVMPSNVNVLIDVLKDVLYSLETNTNTALLALVVYCFSCSKSPIDILREHFSIGLKGTCPCLVKSGGDLIEDCSYVKDFDLYNERLLQIGNFAVSCSSDQRRILTLRSGLASLEALDPHLVPALMLSPHSYHSNLLISSWTREVQDIRDNIFLIVDPTAFAEKAKQMIHQTLVGLLKENIYNNVDVCAVINMGCMVHEFFTVYEKCEPDALVHRDKLLVLITDLDKVQKECKIVSNLLSSKEEFLYNIKMPTKKEASFEQLIKRLKLLYTLVNRIHTLISPIDTDDQLFEDENEYKIECKNATHTICKNYDTYVQSPRKPINHSKSIFARTNIRSSTKDIPLSKLTNRLKTKLKPELSFSVQLDRLFNNSSTEITELPLERPRDSSSVLYKFSPIKNRPSLRKAVLNRLCKMPVTDNQDVDVNVTYDKNSLADATSLQITDILDQMNDLTSKLSECTTQGSDNVKYFRNKNIEHRNVLRLDVNNPNTVVSKRIWNIPVNASIVEMPSEESSSNITLPSNVDTLERINDLDFVESKLNSLKSQLETSL